MRHLTAPAAAVVSGAQARAQAWFLLDIALTLVMLTLTSAFIATLAMSLR